MLACHKYAGLCRQLIAGAAASLGVLACATIFAWLTPTLPGLLGPHSQIPMTSEEASWMVSMPEFGNFVSPIPAGILADRYGRKIVILFSAPIFLIGWIIILYFETLWALNVARVIQGLASGIVYTVIPMYLGEIASPEYRGAVTSIFYCLWWFGHLFEYILGPMLSFRNFTYVSAFTNFIFFSAFLWQPESPYYFLMKKDIDNAHKSLSWLLNTTEEETSKELECMNQSVQEDMQKKASWKELVATSADRRALLILLLAGLLRVYCGLIPLSLYSTHTLTVSGSCFFVSPDNVSVVMGVMMLIGSLCSFFTLDLFGRRSLLFISSSVSGVSMFCAGTFYFLHSHTSVDLHVYSWVPPAALVVLSAVSVVGIFPVSISYTSELFPSNTRGIASSVSSMYTTFLGGVVFKSYLTLSDEFGLFINFYIFAFVCFLGSFLSLFVMPETKGKSFNQIRRELHKNQNIVC